MSARITPAKSETPGWPIARLLPALMVGLVFVSIVPVIGVAWLAAQSNLESSSLQRSELTIDLIERRLEAHLRPVQNQLAFLSDAIARGEIDFDNREQWRVFALGTLAAVPQTVGFVVLPTEGEPSRFVRADRTMRPEQRENIRAADALLARARTMDGPGWGEPVWSFVFGEPILPIIVPVRVRGEFRGVIGAAIGTTDLSRFLKQIELTGERTPFILAGRDHVLAHPKLAKTLNGDARAQTRLVTLEEVGDPVLASIWAPDPNPLSWFRHDARIQGHWNWVGERSFAWIRRNVDAYAPAELIVGYHEAGRESAWARWIVRGILIAGGVLMILTGLAAIYLGRRLAQPILALARAAGAVERLDLENLPALPTSRVREITRANHAFERMANGLKLSATYLPRALVARLTAQQGSLPVNEDRAVTILFSDLEGYTAYSLDRPAAEAAAYLNDLLSRIGPAIEASGGTIDKYTGDGLMAFWGAPDTVPDHARIACQGALAVAKEVETFNIERRARGLHACRMRMGLHTGTVLVGNIGFAGRVDYTAIGEAVNVASRLEQFGRGAPRDGEVTIVASASCREAAGAGFAWAILDGAPADVAAASALPLATLRAMPTIQ
ncbi:MAG: hypothetical protein JWQ58_652 [Reyranella sp.]|nr:hypothetical protein [Reyranella sp.]